MTKISMGILSAFAILLVSGAAQFASGGVLAGTPQDLPGESESTINRAAKSDRAAGPTGTAVEIRTISIQLDGVADTSILVRVPMLRAARNNSYAPADIKSEDQKAACEPVVSVLTEIFKQLQPGRFIT